MKKTKIKSTSQFSKNNEVKSVCLGEIDHLVLMYDKENIDNISSNLTSDYIEKNASLSVEIFTKINSLSSSHNTDFNNLTNLIEKNIDFIQAISVDLSDDISNIVEFNKKISIINKNLDELSDLHNLEIETLEKDISTLNEKFETFENELSNTVPEYETDPVFTEWKDECSAVIIGKDAKIDDADAGIAIGLSASSTENSITIGKKASTTSPSSIAIGLQSYANGHKSTAIGSAAAAYRYSTIIGNDSKSQSSEHTIILGQNSTINSNSENSIIMGQSTKISESDSGIAIGLNTIINDSDSSIAIGRESILSNSRGAVAIGVDSILYDARFSIAIGENSEISNSNSSLAIGQDAKVIGANNTVQIGSGLNTADGTLQFRNYPLVDNNGKIFEERIPDKIIKIIDDLSDVTDLNDAPGIINFLSKKIDTNIADLSNEFNLEIVNVKVEINDLSGSITQDIQNLYNDLSDEIQSVNDVIADLSDTLSNEVFILNSKIDNLSNEFKSEIFSIKTENFDSICEIYNEINELSGNVTQDIENLYNDLSDEIQNVNDAITDLSSSLFELSNSIDNSIETYVNNRITDDSDNSLVTNKILNEKLNIESITYEITSDSQIVDLIPNVAHLIKIKSANTTANLQLPFYSYVDKNNQTHNLKPYENILVMIENNTNVSEIKYNLLTDETTTTLIYTESGVLSNTISNYSAALIKAEYNKPFWFTHHHAYKRITDNKLTIIFSGANQQKRHILEDSHESFSITANAEGKFIFTFDTLTKISYNDRSITLPSEWDSLYNNNYCKLLGWTMTETFAGTDPEYKAGQTFEYDLSYSGRILYFYPIYEIVEVDITDQSVSENVKGSKTVNGIMDLRNSSIFGTNTDFIFNAKTKWQVYAGNSGTCFLKANWNGQTLQVLFDEGVDAKTTYTDKNHEYLYFASTSSDDNKRQLDMNCGYTNTDKGGIFTITVYSIKVGYNKYNKPDFNSVYTSW